MNMNKVPEPATVSPARRMPVNTGDFKKGKRGVWWSITLCLCFGVSVAPVFALQIPEGQEDYAQETRERFIDWTRPQHATCPAAPFTEEQLTALDEAQRSNAPSHDQYMNLSETELTSDSFKQRELTYICDVLLIKTLYEYGIGDFEAMTDTLLRLLAYEEVFSDRYTQVDYVKRRLFQGRIYDALFTYDLLRYVSEKSQHRFCEVFYRACRETQFAEIIRNDTIEYFGPHLENKYRKGMMNRTLGRLYSLNTFKKKETQHITAYAQHIADFLAGDKSYSEYQPYELPGGYWLPGRVYAQDMIDTFDALVKYEFSWNNRSLVLLWALLIHSHYGSTGVLPERLADAWTAELVSEMPRTTSITSGSDLVYVKEDGDFRIEGGTEYRCISGPDAQQESETIYAGCLK